MPAAARMSRLRRPGQQRQPALRQRPGLVEHDHVGLGEPLERGRRLEQRALAHQPAARQHLDRRHRQAQGAGAGDDQHRDGVEQRRLPGRRPAQRPAQEGQERQAVHHRRVGARHPVGDGHEARAALLGQLHQPDDLGQQRAFADRPDPDPQGRAEIDRAGEDPLARAHPLRHGLAGDQGWCRARRRRCRRYRPPRPARRSRPGSPGPASSCSGRTLRVRPVGQDAG